MGTPPGWPWPPSAPPPSPPSTPRRLGTGRSEGGGGATDLAVWWRRGSDHRSGGGDEGGGSSVEHAVGEGSSTPAASGAVVRRCGWGGRGGLFLRGVKPQSAETNLWRFWQLNELMVVVRPVSVLPVSVPHRMPDNWWCRYHEIRSKTDRFWPNFIGEKLKFKFPGFGRSSVENLSAFYFWNGKAEIPTSNWKCNWKYKQVKTTIDIETWLILSRSQQEIQIYFFPKDIENA